MRILYFSRDYTTHDRRFLLKLADSNHEILYLRLESDGNPYEKLPLPHGVNPIDWEGGKQPAITPESWLQLMPAFQQVIKDYQPDIIQAGPVQSCGWMTAMSGFHPYVLVSWGYDILLDSDRDPLMKWITRFTLQHADYFLCDSDAVLEKSKPFRRFDANQIIQFPWGIELERYLSIDKINDIRNQLGWDNQFIILSTRTWEPVYGIDILLHAFQQAYQQLPNLRMIMLGSGSLKNQVDEIIKDHQLNDVIHRPGFVSTEKILDYYMNADLYMSCTYCDGASISLLEAMACGLPVVVTDAFCNKEWVTEGTNGWLASSGNTDNFREKIITAAQISSEQKMNMQTANRSLIKEKADWDKNIKKLISFYNQL